MSAQRWAIVVMLALVITATVIVAALNCEPADINCDGEINVLDVQLVVNSFLEGE